MEPHFIISFILLVLSVCMIVIGYFQSQKNNINLYEKVNARVHNITITETLHKNKTARIGSVNIYTTTRSYNVYIKYIYQVNGISYYYNHKYITVNNRDIANNYINKIRTENKLFTLYYLKSNPSLSSLNIQKNNSIIYYILGIIFMIASIFIYFTDIFENKTETTESIIIL